MESINIEIKNIIMEDFVNYKKPSMFIGLGECDWKCCIEGGFDNSVCQNSSLSKTKPHSIDLSNLIQAYLTNSMTESIVIGGLEPFYTDKNRKDLLTIVQHFREQTSDDIVIYTGYYPHELVQKFPESFLELAQYPNIVMKFGRYVPNKFKKYDKVLEVYLASDDQYGVILNHDNEDLLPTIKALIDNGGYCPCMLNKNENTKCSCLAFREQEHGICHCGIFKKYIAPI